MSRIIDCPCGHQLRAEDDEGLFRAARQHIDQDHTDMQRSDEQIRTIIRERARIGEPVPQGGRTVMKLTLAAVALVLTASSASAQSVASAAAAVETPHAIVAVPKTIKWGPAPATLPAGAKLAVLEGDPTKPGEFTMRLSMPAGYRIPPHFHPVTEHVTVIEGTFYVGMGETVDAAKATVLPAGTFAALQPGVRHFAFTRRATTIQLHGVGPWSLTYVNPADDPRNKPK